MAKDPVDSRLDLSAGDNPPQDVLIKVNNLLADAASRRRYRRFAFVLAVLVVLILGWLLYQVIQAIIGHMEKFSPWVVGIVATLVIAGTVLTLAILRAVFAAPGSDTDNTTMPQTSMMSDALKALSDAIGALRDAMGK